MIIYSNVETPAATYPVTLSEAKAHLRVDGSDHDDYILSLIKSATRVCESYAGLSFITQTRTISLDNFNRSEFILPYGPVSEINSIAYIDADDVNQTVPIEDYKLDNKGKLAKVRVNESWPSTNRSLNNIVITYTTGFGSADAVPAVAKQAILKRVARDYQHRGDEKAGEDTEWMDLLDVIKVYWSAEC